MIIDIPQKSFYSCFTADPHPFLKKEFIDLNSHKVDKVLYLIQDSSRPDIGLVAGYKNGLLLSHFSAPFGGFHYRHENLYISEIERYVNDLMDYLRKNNINQISITFPTLFYGFSFNAKMINALVSNKFIMGIPDLTNWVDLSKFEYRFKEYKCRKFYNQALKNGLIFCELKKDEDKMDAFELIVCNRKKFNRPIYMTFDDLKATERLWPIDFFGVYDIYGCLLAAGILYQFPKKIVYASFWGDNDKGRPLRAMDFIIYNLWNFYKNLGFQYVDLGISTENGGIPNEGLLVFKEAHEALTELKYTFVWTRNK